MGKSKVDLLNRNGFVENVVKVIEQLSEKEKGCCFAIEGSWGIGKTFVIEHLEEQLSIKQSEDTYSDKYFVVHYNCWKYDYYEEPAIAIISAMLNSIQKDEILVSEEIDGTAKASYEFIKEKLTEIAGLYIENRIGINIVNWATDIKNIKENNRDSEFFFDNMLNFNQTIEMVRDKLKEIAIERTIVIMVDELDRCIPQYAIKVLERIHHIFSGLENIIVIMAIDRKQLEHSVEEMFGANKGENSMNIEKYLKKFIDFSISLDYGRINDNFVDKYNFYLEKFLVDERLKNKEEIVKIVSSLFIGMDIRMQEKLMEKIDVVHSIVCKEKVDSSVIVFEILYEVLKLWDFEEWKCLTLLNRLEYPDLAEKLGDKRMKLLKEMVEKSEYRTGIVKENDKVQLTHNLYGDVFWYFANIYNTDNNPYYPRTREYDNLEKELMILKKYCEFSEIMN